MMFLHGHLTRPQDWAETEAPATPSERGKPVAKARSLAYLARIEACLFPRHATGAGSFR
jgi:hypothetical protein